MHFKVQWKRDVLSWRDVLNASICLLQLPFFVFSLHTVVGWNGSGIANRESLSCTETRVVWAERSANELSMPARFICCSLPKRDASWELFFHSGSEKVEQQERKQLTQCGWNMDWWKIIPWIYAPCIFFLLQFKVAQSFCCVFLPTYFGNCRVSDFLSLLYPVNTEWT